MRGELLPAPDVKRAWTDIVALMRARLLVLPDKIAPVVYETTSIAQAKDVIKKAVFEVLTEIATTDVEISARPDGDGRFEDDGDERAESSNATAKPDDKPMGRSKQKTKL